MGAGGGGVLGRAVRLDGQADVVQVSRVLELAQGKREARRQVPPLPLVQEAAGQAGMEKWPGRPGGRGDGAGYATGKGIREIRMAWGFDGLGGIFWFSGRRHFSTVHVRSSMLFRRNRFSSIPAKK